MTTTPQTQRLKEGADTLCPEDGALMLALARQMDETTKRKDNAKRDLVRGFLRSPVLLAGGLAAPLVTPSTETGVFTAFSDEEAAEAWAADRHPAAPAPVGWELVPAAEDERAARLLWLDRLEAAHAAMICVNPNGPMTFLVYHQELTEWRLRLRRAPLEPPPAPWLDRDARIRERARLKDLIERLADVVESGELARMEALDPEMKTRHDFGSLKMATIVKLLLAHWRLHFEQYYWAINEMTWASIMLAHLGDPWRAVDGLLETAERIRELDAQGIERPRHRVDKDPKHRGFLIRNWRAVVEALPHLTIPYREEERAALGKRIRDHPRAA